MTRLKTIFITLGLLTAFSAVQAQVVTFENNDYAQVGVYDFWEASPFRTGELSGNCQVVENPYRNAANASAKVLGCQRSIYGSNLYGARIDLLENQRFELTPTEKYVHVLIHKPIEGRCMLIPLGKHSTEEWAHQHTDVLQATSLSLNKAAVGEWSDVVFPIKGTGNIDIYSLVVVFDCESPHRLPMPFMAYIDDINVSSDKAPRTVSASAGDAASTKKAANGFITITNSQRNGTVVTADGKSFTGGYQHLAGTPLRVKSVPEKGFRNGGIYVKHGSQLEKTEFYAAEAFDKDNVIEIPASVLDTDVIIEGVMLEVR